MKRALIGLMALCSTAFGSEPTFSNVQLDNLHYAYNFGEQYQKSGKEKSPHNRYDNNGLGYIMAAISWKESSAGANLKAGKGHHSYGVFKITYPPLRPELNWKVKTLVILK